MNFCESCGERLGDGPYCGQCGHPVSEPADATRQLPVTDPDPMVQQADQPAQQPAEPARQDAATHVKNPFADIGLADYVRDLVALILLIATFGMRWDFVDTAADKIYVVLASLVAMAALTLPYLKRGHVLPGNWGNAEVRIARTLAVVPYFVVVALTLVVDIVSDDVADGGIGVGVMVGLTGAVLTAQSRDCELDDGHGQAMVWHTVAVAMGAIVAVLTVVRLVFVLTDLDAQPDWTSSALAIGAPLIILAILAVPIMALVRRHAPAQIMLMTVGAVGVVLAFWRLSDDSQLADVISVRHGGPAELLWLGIAAAVSAPGVSRLLRPVSASALWLETARRILGLTTLLAVLAAAYWAIFMVGVADERGSTITLVVLSLLAAAAAAVGRNSIRHDATEGRVVALASAAVLAILGVIVLAVQSAADVAGRDLVGALVVAALLTFAALVLLGLTVPKSVRDELGPVHIPAKLQRSSGTPPDVEK